MKQQQLEEILKKIIEWYDIKQEDESVYALMEEARVILGTHREPMNRAEARRIANGGKDGGPYE